MWQSTGCGLLATATLVGALGLSPTDVLAQLQDQTRIRPTNDLPNPYTRVWPWGDLPWGSYDDRAAFIGAEEGPDGNLYFLGRCRENSCTGKQQPPILKLDAGGNLLHSWGVGQFDFPHGFTVDDGGHVWTADQRGHVVRKWSSDGELLMTIGRRGTAGDPPELLSEPTDVAVTPGGEIFVTEGHSFSQGANRVSKFDSDGSFLTSWGSTGSGAGEFNVPHSIALDSQGRVFVADRANNRIQIFDQGGELLDVWYQFGRPSGIAIDADDRIYVADSESWGTDNPGWKKGIRVGSARDGAVDYLIEDVESTAIEHSGAEGVGVDSDGNVYGAVVRRRMLERHASGSADPATVFELDPAPAPTHVSHVARGFGAAPDGRGLVATATTEAGTALLHANFAAGDLSDLEAMRRHAGHVLHALDPVEGSPGPGLGFGLLRAAEAVASHIGLAADAAGASASLRTHAGHVATVAATVARRAERAAEVARRLQTAPSIRRASPLVAELRLLTYRMAEGGDLNGDGEMSLDQEAGLQQLEAHVYLMLEGERLLRIIR